MASDDRAIEPGSEMDLAIERALEGANLRAGGSLSASAATVGDRSEHAPVEAGEAMAAPDGE